VAIAQDQASPCATASRGLGPGQGQRECQGQGQGLSTRSVERVAIARDQACGRVPRPTTPREALALALALAPALTLTLTWP
jgi:hypothetical protein